MLSIVYVSAATSDMSDEDVAAILVQARANNSVDGLTGALLYHQGRFIQILEGPDATVHSRFATIEKDSRHRNVHVMSEKHISDREFPEWTMAFRPLTNSSVEQLDGFDEFFVGRTGKARLKHADNETQQFLEWLAEYWLPPV